MSMMRTCPGASVLALWTENLLLSMVSSGPFVRPEKPPKVTVLISSWCSLLSIQVSCSETFFGPGVLLHMAVDNPGGVDSGEG